MSDFSFTPGNWSVSNGSLLRVNSTIPNDPRTLTICGVHRIGRFTGEAIGDPLANARLIAAAPDLLRVQTMGAQLNTPALLDWIAERLVNVYHESPNIDFVHTLRSRAEAGREAVRKALYG